MSDYVCVAIDAGKTPAHPTIKTVETANRLFAARGAALL
jgi:hypothetical protein